MALVFMCILMAAVCIGTIGLAGPPDQQLTTLFLNLPGLFESNVGKVAMVWGVSFLSATVLWPWLSSPIRGPDTAWVVHHCFPPCSRTQYGNSSVAAVTF